MPGLLIAFFVLVGLGSGSALLGPPAAWAPVDPTAHSHGKLGKATPLTTVSAPAYQVAAPDATGKEECRAVVFAVTGGGRRMRAQIDGQEQLLDSSWSFDVQAAPNTRRAVVVRYIDPTSREETCHRVSFICVGDRSWTGTPTTTVSNGAPCSEAAGPQAGIDQSGKPRLEFVRPARVMTTQYVPGVTYLVGTATLLAEVRGEITEEWYCPRVEWEYPLSSGLNPQDTTKSMHEEDCAPFTPELAAKQTRRYTTRVAFPEGTWTVTVSLWKGDHMLARQSAQVTVGNSDPNPGQWY